jgi:hypothetical protein
MITYMHGEGLDMSKVVLDGHKVSKRAAGHICLLGQEWKNLYIGC